MAGQTAHLLQGRAAVGRDMGREYRGGHTLECIAMETVPAADSETVLRAGPGDIDRLVDQLLEQQGTWSAKVGSYGTIVAGSRAEPLPGNTYTRR